MSLELIYTSAPRGLNAASSGFCTVAATGGISRQVRGKLESLSGYQFHFDLSDPQANLNPVNFAHTRVRVGADTLSVLSRIAFCGSDYSGRTNKIAHHVLLEHGEQMSNGPAWMMMAMARRLFVVDWKGDPKHMPPRSVASAVSPEPRSIEPATTWEAMTGDAGWGGALAQAFRENPKVPAFVIFKPGQELLPLFEESLALLPPEERWQVGFATYYTALPAGCQYHWRGVLAGSPASREIARFPNAKVVDLTAPLAPAGDSIFAEAARTGQTLAPVKAAARPKVRVVDRVPEPVGAAAATGSVAGPAYAEEVPSRGPVDEIFAGTSPAQGVSSPRRSRLVPALVAAVVLLATSTVVLLVERNWPPRQAPSAAPVEPKTPGELKSGESSESGTSEPAQETPVESTVAETSVSKTPQEGAAAAPAEGDAPSEGATTPGTGKPPSSPKPEPTSPAVAQQPDSVPKSPGRKTPEKPEPPPQPPEEKGKTPKEEDAKAAAGEEAQELGGERAGSRDKPKAETEVLPALASELADRDELEKQKYETKLLDPPKPHTDGSLRWPVDKASAFVNFARPLRRAPYKMTMRFAEATTNKIELDVGTLATTGKPSAACHLVERNGRRELICEVNAGARERYHNVFKYLVLEVVDNEGRCVLACPLSKLVPQKVPVELGYSDTGQGIRESLVSLDYSWLGALKVDAPADNSVTVTPRDGDRETKLLVRLKEPLPDLIETMKPNWATRPMLEREVQQAKNDLARVTQRKREKAGQTLLETQRKKIMHDLDSEIKQARGRIRTAQKKLSANKADISSAAKKAKKEMDEVGRLLAEVSPIRVFDPWGRVVAELRLNFARCEPEDVKGR